MLPFPSQGRQRPGTGLLGPEGTSRQGPTPCTVLASLSLALGTHKLVPLAGSVWERGVLDAMWDPLRMTRA